MLCARLADVHVCGKPWATLSVAAALAMGTAIMAGGAGADRTAAGRPAPPVRITIRPREIDPFQSALVSVSGVAGGSAEVRLLGATDRAGLAYEWAPYRWQRLRLRTGRWLGRLPAPALPGIYRIQLRFDRGRALLTSERWLLRVFPRRTGARRSFPTALAAARDYVGRLPGHEVMVAARRWPQAAFDHRDPRLNGLFVIAYAPRGHDRLDSRRGSFVTVVRDGYRGRWRVLEATIQPYT